MCWSKTNKLVQYFSCTAVENDDASPEYNVPVGNDPDIIIVGAGAAGLSCAKALLDYGFKKLLVLEAEARIGGRIHTVSFGKNYVDTGARFCIGEKGNPVYELVCNTDHLISCADIHFSLQHIRSNGDVVPRSMILRLSTILTDLMESPRRLLFEGSIEDYMKQGFYQAIKERRDSVSVPIKIVSEYCENLVKSANFYQVSMYNNSHMYHCPGDPMLGWKHRGFIDFISELINDKGDSDGLGVMKPYIKFNRKVKTIHWNQDDGRVKVICHNGETFQGDVVVVTVPLGVLKKYYNDMFIPKLPQNLSSAIENVAYRQICQVYLLFDTKFWPEYWTGFALLWRKPDIEHLLQKRRELIWISDITHIHTVKNQPNILVGFIAGYSAKLVEKMTDKQIGAGFLYALTVFLKSMDVRVASKVVVSKWCSNDNFLGGYSFRSGATEDANIPIGELGTPLTSTKNSNPTNQKSSVLDTSNFKPEVLFAGEATSEKFYSTVHGAVESGYREAKRIAVFYNSSPQ